MDVLCPHPSGRPRLHVLPASGYAFALPRWLRHDVALSSSRPCQYQQRLARGRQQHTRRTLHTTHSAVQLAELAAPELATAAAAQDAVPPPRPRPSGGGSAAAAAAEAAAASAGRGPTTATQEEAWDPPEWLQRTTLLLGADGVAALRSSRVCVVGLGGVGSYVAEFLVRAGVGSLAVVDGDVVDVTNKNRQLPALDSTVGQPKARVMSQRLRDINPDLNLVVRQEFVGPDGAAARLLDEVAAALDRGAPPAAAPAATATATAAAAAAKATTKSAPAGCNGSRSISSNGNGGGIGGGSDGSSSCSRNRKSSNGSSGDSGGGGGLAAAADADADAAAAAAPLHWVVDCIDSVAPKLAVVAAAAGRGAHVVSSMGAGGRMDPLAVRIADISDTWGDPFAATCRRGLRRQYDIRSGVTVVFSTEPCRRASLALTAASPFKRSYYGTISFIPAIFGLQIAAHVVNEITGGPMLASEAEQRRQLRRERLIATGGKAGAAAAAAAAAAGGGAAGSGGGGSGSSSRSRTRRNASGGAPAAAVPGMPGAGGDAQAAQQQQQQHNQQPAASRRKKGQHPTARRSAPQPPPAGTLAAAVQAGSGFEGADI